MSCILYYSNACEPSKKLLQTIVKTQNAKDIHFICIDNRVKGQDGKIYIILKDQQKIIMPENVTRVPALLLLNQNYKVIYGDDIYKHLRPKTQELVKEATKNNGEPMNFQEGFAFGGFGGGGGGFGGIVSDNYSFLDQNGEDLSVKGNGGVRQMHNYVSLEESMSLQMSLPEENTKIKEGEMSVEALQRRRDEDLAKFR